MLTVVRRRRRALLSLVVLTTAMFTLTTKNAAAQERRADEFSPGFLGIYRKVMEIEPEITKYADKYQLDPLLATAVCMYESGGNADLTSGAGAHGYFQVMPSTFRLLRVDTNIEAGIKYLRQLMDQFGREDYALAAYNGGPGRVQRGAGCRSNRCSTCSASGSTGRCCTCMVQLCARRRQTWRSPPRSRARRGPRSPSGSGSRCSI